MRGPMGRVLGRDFDGADRHAIPDSGALLLTERQAAARLQLSVKSLYRLRKSGKIGYVPFGVSGVRYTPDQLTAWIRQARTDAE